MVLFPNLHDDIIVASGPIEGGRRSLTARGQLTPCDMVAEVFFGFRLLDVATQGRPKFFRAIRPDSSAGSGDLSTHSAYRPAQFDLLVS